jgi:hypothetical protein
MHGREEAGFPAVSEHAIPAGSAIRALSIGSDPESSVARIAYHAVGSMPGYGAAFVILDTVVRQLSKDMVKVVPPGEPIVDGIEPLSA